MANKKGSKKDTFSMQSVRTAIKNTNKFVLDTTEEVLDESLKRTEDWQSVGEKALKGGLKLAAKQQDLIFDTLEALKKQIKKGKKRAAAL